MSARRKTAGKPAKRAQSATKKATRRRSSAPAKRVAPEKRAQKKTSAKKTSAHGLAPKKPAAKKARAKQQPKRVYYFGDARAEGRADMRELLGGKGANLAEMTRLGVPVPPGFTIATTACAEYVAGGALPARLRREALAALERVERVMRRRFGDPDAPLLVSVRSGARVSMPGMMDTVLNLGLNDATLRGLAALSGERFAHDSYRRFIQMYGDVVLEVPRERFEARLEELKRARGFALDTELEAADWRALTREFMEIVEQHTGRAFPQDPHEQLWGAVAAVFRSWQNERARRYRRIENIPDAWGTAVNVQAMVFGNMGDDCATGVAFTRNPTSGERHFYGEYLKNAQGEDVVAGVRTPQPINRASRGRTADAPTLEAEMPRAYAELTRIYKRLEKHYRDMQDIEFTIEKGKLWMLQTRTGKRTTQAALRIAVDLAKEKLITREEAVCRVAPGSLEQLLHPALDPDAPKEVIARGLPASPGAASGRVVFTADEAEARARAGEKVVLVRSETSPEDIHGMHVAEGILTARGGMTSHAAVVARGMGKCCVVGCGLLRIDAARNLMSVDGHSIRAGETITLDGASGLVMRGEVATVRPELGKAFGELMRWADRIRRLKVRTNADTPEDARIAREFGAEGIGLCRTEHMFFEPGRVQKMREMILAADAEARAAALEDLLPMQRADFAGIFHAMAPLPVAVRLLDPPLHEFLPHGDDEIRQVAETLGTDAGSLRAKVDEVREFNPMLGHRGCRLGISYPEIYAMQARAIALAACDVLAEGVRVRAEIMLPLVAHAAELERLRALVEGVVAEVLATRPGLKWKPAIGTMLEVPRAALTAEEIARHADFFSFGTNDLTQTAYALSRDDAGKFLPDYLDSGLLEDDPFVSIDEAGIGRLMRMGAEAGRRARPKLKVGICGEHGGDPKSIRFCASLGFDYVSCSPFRVPVARLAAAQAALELGNPRRRA